MDGIKSRNLSNGIKLEVTDATASQSWINLSNNCPAGVWCAILVEIVDFDLTNYSGSGGANAPIKNSTTANLNADTSLDDRIVTFDQIKAGGVGWYCLWFKYDVTTAAPTIRCGIGTDSGMTSGAGYITVGRVGFFILSQDNVEPSTTGNVPSFALPDYGNAYSVTDNIVDSNKKVTWGATSTGDVDRFSVIYAIGDSKANDKGTDAPTNLTTQTGLVCYAYARSGQGYDYMLANIADLQALKVDSSTEVQRDIWADIDEFPQVAIRPNCLLFSNFGVNDINGSTYTGVQTVSNFVSLASTLGYDDVIMTDINPCAANVGISAGEVTEIKSFNSQARTTCRDNGWIFVPLYYALADNPANPDNIINPTYSTDDLHPTGVGSIVINGLISCARQSFLQRGSS